MVDSVPSEVQVLSSSLPSMLIICFRVPRNVHCKHRPAKKFSQIVKDSIAELCITSPFLSFSPSQACPGSARFSSFLLLHRRTHMKNLQVLTEKGFRASKKK